MKTPHSTKWKITGGMAFAAMLILASSASADLTIAATNDPQKFYRIVGY